MRVEAIPDRLRDLINGNLTETEVDSIIQTFAETCIVNRQVLWSGMLRKAAQRWANEHDY